MSTAMPTPGKSAAVTIVGLITLLVGGAYAALGGGFLFTGAAAVRELQGDPAGGLGPVLQVLAGFLAVIGVAFLFSGVLGVSAGLGVLMRRQWGRLLAFLVAAVAGVWGLLTLVFADQGAIYVA